MRSVETVAAYPARIVLLLLGRLRALGPARALGPQPAAALRRVTRRRVAIAYRLQLTGNLWCFRLTPLSAYNGACSARVRLCEKLQVRDTPGEARDTRPARSAGRGEIWRFPVQTGQNLDLREVSRDDGRRRGLGYSMSEVPGRIRVIHGSTFDDNRPSKRVPGCENAKNQFH